MKNADLLEYQTPETNVSCLALLSIKLMAIHISDCLNTKGHAGSKKNILHFIQSIHFPNAPIWIKVLSNNCTTCELNRPFSHQKQLAENKTLKVNVCISIRGYHLTEKALYCPPQKEIHRSWQ